MGTLANLNKLLAPCDFVQRKINNFVQCFRNSGPQMCLGFPAGFPSNTKGESTNFSHFQIFSHASAPSPCCHCREACGAFERKRGIPSPTRLSVVRGTPLHQAGIRTPAIQIYSCLVGGKQRAPHKSKKTTTGKLILGKFTSVSKWQTQLYTMRSAGAARSNSRNERALISASANAI